MNKILVNSVLEEEKKMVSSQAKTESPNKKKTAVAQTTKGNVDSVEVIFWKYFKNQLKVPEIEVSNLKQAKIPAKVSGLEANLFRFFDPKNAETKGVTINDYESLKNSPELILYEGYRQKVSGGEIIIKKMERNGTSFLDEKIKQGEITEVGVIIPLTRGKKFLKGFGNFLMMGGFLLIIILAVAIYIGISLIFK
jgi:hypothetical protein